MISKMVSFFLLLVTFLIVPLDGIGWTSEKAYPNRPIEMIIPFPPGGPTDISARIIQQPLEAALGVPITFTYKAGANGALGAGFLANAKPDGYTIGNIPISTFISTPQLSSVPYSYHDVIPICIHTVDPVVVVSRPGTAWRTLEELVDFAQKNPGKLTYGSPGMGSACFVVVELIKLHFGLDIPAVQFQGTSPVKTAVLGGHVDFGTGGFSSFASLIKAGQIVPLVVTAPEPLADFPEIPIITKKGLAKPSIDLWNGIYAPQKCPKDVVEKLALAMGKVMKDPAIISQFKKSMFLVDYRDSKETLKLMQQGFDETSSVVKRLGIRK